MGKRERKLELRHTHAGWICTRCIQLELKHPNPLPLHHRTCPKRGHNES